MEPTSEQLPKMEEKKENEVEKQYVTGSKLALIMLAVLASVFLVALVRPPR
jgi:hypothetical protein